MCVCVSVCVYLCVSVFVCVPLCDKCCECNMSQMLSCMLFGYHVLISLF